MVWVDILLLACLMIEWKLYRLAAAQGYATAQDNLGLCYAKGEGVKQDYAEAVKWFRLSAEQGNATAQNNLGNCYHNGNGVTQDYAEAVKWYRLSAEQGYARAQCNLGLCYYKGDGVKQIVPAWRKFGILLRAFSYFDNGSVDFFGTIRKEFYGRALFVYAKAFGSRPDNGRGKPSHSVARSV